MNVVARSTLAPQEAWTYDHSIYLPCMSYSLPLGTMTQQQCLTLQKQIKKAILPKCGFNQNMTHSVIYGPSDLCGIEFHMLYIEQGAAQLQYLLKCLHTDGILGITLNSFVSRCFVGPFNVYLVLFEDCNAKNPSGSKLCLPLTQETSSGGHSFLPLKKMGRAYSQGYQKSCGNH